MASHYLPDPGEPQTSLHVSPAQPQDGDNDSGIEDELRLEQADSTIFLAFKGDIGDTDFQQKLDKILNTVPNLVSMESDQLRLQKVEPWNSVRVTFNIPREAAERLRLLAQGNNQQLRELGILSVQIEGEGAINLALPHNQGQVRMNGPVAANSAMRIDGNFAMQGGTGIIRMNSPAVAMMSQGANVSSAVMTPGGSTDLQPRTPRPPSQQGLNPFGWFKDGTTGGMIITRTRDTINPLMSSLNVQQSNHPSGSLGPQIHPMQNVVVSRPINPANFQQFQQQTRLPQHTQVSQGMRQSFAGPSQVPVPPGWNQLASGALQPPPAQAAIGTLNQGWKKSPLNTGPVQQQQFPQRPSLATVQTPSHPPPPYPFGSQQAAQTHTNFPSMANPNQFSGPPMKALQGGPSRVPTPLQQPHLTNKSPASSPSSSFQQSSPVSSPTVNQVQQQAMGPRSGQATPMPQGFQQPPVSSPSRGGMIAQGNAAGGFMMQQAPQQNQGPQAIHTGVTKRLPPGFQAGQGNANFLQGQTPPGTAGSPSNGAGLQQQGSTGGQTTVGGSVNGSSHSQMQVSHGGPNVMQNNLMGIHSNLNNQQAGSSGVNQVNMAGLHGQNQQANQSHLLSMQQQIISSQGQMVNLQGQAPLNTQAQQMVLSRNQLMPQGQMMGTSPGQNLGQTSQRMTPPKQMLQSHNQMMTSQGQSMMQQMEQIIQGNKQGFSAQNPAGVMGGPNQIIRGANAGLQNAMMHFPGQVSQQGSVNNTSHGVNMQGQGLRAPIPGQHLQQTHGDSVTQPGSDLNALLPDLSMPTTGNMASQHMQNMPGVSGQHFPGHGLPFGSPFGQGGNGNQMGCGQNPSFPINKDVTLTSPLLVNLLQSDISAGHFGVNSKQNNGNPAKPKKKKPPRKKKNQQAEEQISATEPRMEDPDPLGIVGDQGSTVETTQKLNEFPNRPAGFPPQPVEQRSLQQIPSQLMQQLGQQPQSQGGQTQQPTPPQQMMMMLMMQQQDQKSVRLPGQQGDFNRRPSLNSEAQRMPMQPGGNMPVMVNMPGSGSIPPSPDKQRMPMAPNVSLGNNGRKMGFPDSGNQSGSPLGEMPTTSALVDIPDQAAASGQQNNMAPHLLLSQNQLMMSGNKSGNLSSMTLSQGANPQQQLANSMPGPHGHHFSSVQTPSQTSRPKTPNRASPRPYYPQTPNNRPPSTEPSEISLSPERLNASIAGLFPPQINIPLPPRPTLNRGFDQQGLNPTTLKAIGQAPPGLTVTNPTGFVPSHKMDIMAGKQTGSSGNKRASPSNSRRSSPGSSRKTTPSPGRQNLKNNKFVLGPQQNPGILHNLEIQRNLMQAQTSMQSLVPGPPIGPYPPVSLSATCSITEENKDSSAMMQETESQVMQNAFKEQAEAELKAMVQQELKMSSEEMVRKELQPMDHCKPPSAEEIKTMVSPAMRDAPTSLSQLLDHSAAPNLTIKTAVVPITESPPLQLLSDDPKIADIPPVPEGTSSSNSEIVSTPNPLLHTGPRGDTMEPSTNVSPNLPSSSVKQPAGQTSVSSSVSQNQITVFVTSNPITTSSTTTDPMTSHLQQQSLMPTVVNVQNMGNKVIVSEGQQASQSTVHSPFITPVFFNSPSIIQVMKGSKQGNLPVSAAASNSNMAPQSVAVVGSLHIPQNIQLSAGTPSSTPPSSTVSSMHTTRPVLVNPPQTTAQSPSVVLPPTPFRESNIEDVSSQLGVTSDECPPIPSQSVASSTCDSIKNSSASSKGQPKVIQTEQILFTKVKNNLSGGTGTGNLETNKEELEDGDKTPPLANLAATDPEVTTAISADSLCPTNTSSVGVPAPSAAQSSIQGELRNVDNTVPERNDSTLDTISTEKTHEIVSSKSTRQEERPASNKESAPEKSEGDTQDIPESEATERSKPLSRRNSKIEEPQEVLESGQRKRSARPGSASAKESGASPTQSKRRKSK
ncbi:nuclear receptor coactivator 6 isoform X2 [Xenopus laevis]|uniref:Nuclear receptor coactivator 6 isoform X2 n=1 Tax=Xenopus laevis TaxID=8355 RepID=A0A8J1LVQ4_XENLA|nr:nuclear receptor coactivator 6 isoform X2 [Xenopus laevis]